jgi:hypothetical protein
MRTAAGAGDRTAERWRSDCKTAEGRLFTGPRVSAALFNFSKFQFFNYTYGRPLGAPANMI